MYSLIKYISCYLNGDIGYLIYRLYSDLIQKSIERNIFYELNFNDEAYIFRHTNSIQTHVSYKTRYCQVCCENIAGKSYRRVLYIYVVYSNPNGYWICSSYTWHTRAYHLKCFERIFGIIYDFKVNENKQVVKINNKKAIKI